MSFLKSFLKHYAVYWAPLPAGPDGIVTFDNPVELRCRWEEKVQMVLTVEQRKVVTNHQILMEESLQVGGRLWRGRLADATTDPNETNDVQEILAQASADLVDATQTARMAYC